MAVIVVNSPGNEPFEVPLTDDQADTFSTPHDMATCDKPVCVETMRIIRERERKLRKPRGLTYGANQEGS